MAGTILDIGKPEPLPNYLYCGLDGDVMRVVVADASPDPSGASMIATTEFKKGRPIKTDNMPTRALLKNADEPVFDIEVFGSGYILSERAKGVIDSFEPDIHQFLPINVENNLGEKISQKYFLVVCQRIDSINRDLTTPNIEPPFAYMSLGAEGSRIVLDKDKINGRHLWVESFLINTHLISSSLFSALSEAGCDGWQILHEIEEI